MFLIRNIRLIDGTGAAPREGVSIAVEDGTILDVGADLAAPAGASVVDGTGLTAIPGLIDMHTHFGGSSDLEHPACGDRHETYDYVEAR